MRFGVLGLELGARSESPKNLVDGGAEGEYCPKNIGGMHGWTAGEERADEA